MLATKGMRFPIDMILVCGVADRNQPPPPPTADALHRHKHNVTERENSAQIIALTINFRHNPESVTSLSDFGGFLIEIKHLAAKFSSPCR